MKIFILLFCFIAIATAQEPKEKIWRSLTGKYYRPGYWWTIEWSIEKHFPGSKNTIEALCEGWKVVHPGEEIKTTTLSASYPIQSSMPSLSIHLLKKGQQKQILAQEYLHLSPLQPSDIFCGFYKSNTIEKAFRSCLQTLPFAFYLQPIDFLPGLMEALQPFHLIVLGNEETLPSQEQALMNWVKAGGVLWIPREKLNQSATFRKFLVTLEKQTWNRIEIWQAGWGTILSVPIDYESDQDLLVTFLRSIMPFWKKQLSPKRDYTQNHPLQDISPSPQWGKPILFSLWAICAVHAFLFSLVLKNKKYPSQKKYLLLLFIVLFFSGSIFGVFFSYMPVSHYTLSVLQAISGENIAIEHNYIKISSLNRSTKRLFFPALPMPVLPFGKCIEIARHRDGWQILVEDASIFLYTQSIVSFPGFFQWEKEQNSLYFYNQTKTKLENLVYLEQGFYQSLEKKDTDSFPYCPVSFWNTSQMPPFWQENRLLFWLREIFPTPFITAHKEPSSNNTNHFAFRAQKCLVCIFQNTKNTPKKSDQ